MKKQNPLKKFTGSLTPFVACPPVQSLVNLDHSSPWSHELLSNTTIREYSHRRCELISLLDYLFECVPNIQMDFGEALAFGLVEERKLALVYKLLIDMLDEEEYSERLLLYLPIELIPGTDWKISPESTRITEDFVEVYIRKWHVLLLRQDIRANFVNGDIPETEIHTGPLPKVVKAAHLIPALIHKGILSYGDAITMVEECNSEVLRRSIEEILPFCTLSACVSKGQTTSRDSNWLSNLIQNNVSDINSLRQIHLANPLHKPSRRIAWEMQQDELYCIDNCASEIAQALINGTLNFKKFKDLLAQTVDQHTTLIGITSLEKALDSIVQTDFMRAQDMYIECEPLIDKLWHANVLSIKERIEILWSHLLAVDIVETAYLEKRSVTIAQFEEDVNLDQNTQVVAMGIAHVIQESIPLSSFLLPVVLVYGSRVKGYAAQRSDTDIAIFVRPHVSLGQRDHIQNLVAKLLEPFGITNKVFEFWLEETGNDLRIRDFVNPDRSLGDSLLVQILFGGVWFGNYSSIHKLYETVLQSYLVLTDKFIQGQPIREFLLEEMERDALQYRLMHNGYHHFYPERRTSCIPVTMVDSSGAFWDSGYRRLATKLFLKKVFLPHIPK